MTETLETLEAVADGVVLVDASGRVQWANRRFLELAATTAKVVAGSSAADLLPVPMVAGDHRGQIGRQGEIPVDVVVRPGAGGLVVQVRDLRPWLGTQMRATGQADTDRALGRVFQGAMSIASDEFQGEERSEVIAQVLAEHGRRLIAATDCLIALVGTGAPGTFRVAGAAGPWAGPLLGHEYTLEGSLVGQALPSRSVFETSSGVGSSSHSRILTGGGIRTARLVPIVSDRPLPDGRTALGTVGFYSRRSRPFTEAQRRLMDDFARLVALSLIRASLRRAVRVGAERLALGVELAVDLGRTLDVREVVGRILERSLDAVNAERAALLRIEGEDTVTEDARDRLGLRDVPGYRHPIAQQPLMDRAVRTREPVAGGHYLGGQLPRELRAALEEVRHTLTVPLVLDGEAVAVMVLSRRQDVPFGPDEVDTIRLLAGLAALALRNAWLYAAAKEANLVKSDFLNMAAHELRTPFTVVAGYISMLSEGSLGALPAAWRQPVATLDAKAAELGRLLEDLLLVSRLESGGLPVRRRRIEVNQIADAALARALGRAGLVGADLAVDGAAGNTYAFADADHVARILDNLVNNAITYSRGTPWIRVRVRAGREGVRVEVEDHGRGIAGSDAERVFDRFYRIEGDHGTQAPGSGLGLYISRQLAERLGGRLELEWSRQGEGSRFVLTLPPA